MFSCLSLPLIMRLCFFVMLEQMAAPGYADKVPEAVRETNTKKLGELEAHRESILKSIRQFESLK